MQVGRSVLGMALLILLATVISTDRRAIRLRTVGSAFLLQIGIGALILFVPAGKQALALAAGGVDTLLGYGNAGIAFVFGGLVGPRMIDHFGTDGFVFGLRVLPMIIFVTALMSVLYHLGVMRWVVLILGSLFATLLGVSRFESFSAVTTIFLGQSEMPGVVRPFVAEMSGAELFAVMASGMAAVSGSVLAGYAGLGVRLDYLLAASFMAVPGGLLFGKLVCPTTEPSRIRFEAIQFDQHRPVNLIQAAASGAEVGLRIAALVGAMLIAFIGLIALADGMLGGIGASLGHPGWSLEALLGRLFAPVAWLIGVPWPDAGIAGNFIGQKIILNEFVAYAGLAPYLGDAAAVAAGGRQVLDPRTIAIVSFALCGFANLSSIAVLTGGFNVVAPERRAEVARFGLRAVAAGTLSNLMSADIAGLFS